MPARMSTVLVYPTPGRDGAMMLKAIQCNTSKRSFHRVTNLDNLDELAHDPDHVIWLDLHKPSMDDLDRVAKAFNLHPLAVEDATHEHQRPKIEEYDSFFFVVFYTIDINSATHRPDVCELDMFVGKNYLITVHEKELSELDEAELRWTRNASQLEWGIGILLYSLLDTIVDRYFPIVDALVDQSEEIEERIFSTRTRESKMTFELLELKKRFLLFRRIASPERDVLNVLTNRDSPVFSEHVNVYFRDVYDHITRVADTLDLYRDQIATAMDANLSIASNELNKVMRTMTAASIILMFDALVAGIYGMNFVNMPELHWYYGYFLVLVFMLVVSILLGIYFKRRSWL